MCRISDISTNGQAVWLAGGSVVPQPTRLSPGSSKQSGEIVIPKEFSSGEFVGMVADDPDCKIELKSFHSEILNDHEVLKQEQDNYKEIPVIRKLDNTMVQRNYLLIKKDVQEIIQSELKRVLSALD